MADVELRSITVTIANERIQIRTDHPDTEMKEIVEFINNRYDRSAKFQMDGKQRLALLAIELTSEIAELRKQLRRAKTYCQQMEKDVKDISALLDEGIEANQL